jgi:hypothetical protein
MNTNRAYKASLFSDLFSDEEVLREVYPALSGNTIAPDAAISVNTLSDVIFMEQINDLSFTIGDRLVVLIEHQSSVNPNIPLRLLIYSGRLYEKLTDSNNIYSTHRLPLPRPEFYVLYNGQDEIPDKMELRLSEMFSDTVEKPALDLIVPVYNINQGHNKDLLTRSPTMYGYSMFVYKVREYEKTTKDRGKAIVEAIGWCMKKGILIRYLKENSSEVSNMLLTEWKTEDAKRVWQREAREDGIKIGEERKISRYESQLSAKDAQIAALQRKLQAAGLE